MPKILMPYTVHLDHTLRVTPLNTLFAKGDSAAHRFELKILRAGVQDELTGCNVVCKFYRMSDSAVVSMPGSVEDGKAVAVLNAACYDYIGRFALTIAIQNGEEETTVFYGDGYMHGQNSDTSISGEYIIYDINTLLEKISEIDAATQAANTAASNANTATENANTATGKANTAANTANTAAANANTAKDAANAAAVKIDGMTVSAKPVATGTATADLSTVDGHYHIALGLPKGDTGATPQISVQVQTGAAGSEASVSVSGTAEAPAIHLTIPKGDTGAIENLTINGKPVESGTITIKADDVGARPSDWTPTADDVGALAKDGTAADSSKLGGVASAEYVRAGHVLTVGPGCRFTTINAAIEAAREICTKEKRVLIRIMPGVYEEEIVLNPNPGIDFEGDDWSNTMVKYPSVYPNAPVYTCGQGSFRNLTFYSSCPDEEANPSYGVHVEYQVAPDAGGVVFFERCKMQGRRGAAIGAGLGENAGVYLLDCLCISETTNSVYAHGYPENNVSGQTFTAHRCDFRSLSGGNALHVDDVNGIYGLSGSELTVECVACRGGKMAMRTAESTFQGYVPDSGDVRLSAFSAGNEFVGANYDNISIGLYVVCMRSANAMLFVPWQDAHKYALTIQSVLNGTGSDVTGTVSLHSRQRNGFLLSTTSTEAGPYWVQAVVYPGI